MFPPNHGQIAGWGASEIVVWDINSDKTTHLPAAGTEGSIISLTWSPDGQAMAYLQMVTDPSSPCPPVGKTSLVRVDLSSLQQEVVLVAESPGYVSANWDAPNRIRLFDLQGNEWRYNFVTQELTKE